MISPENAFQSLPEGSSIRWKVPADLPYFAGHFPGSPILPAIAILDASEYLLRRNMKQPGLRVSRIDGAKFHNPIVPGQAVRIELVEKGEGTWSVEWLEDGGDREFAALSLRL